MKTLLITTIFLSLQLTATEPHISPKEQQIIREAQAQNTPENIFEAAAQTQSPALYFAAASLYAESNTDKAVIALEKSLHFSPTFTRARLNLSQLYLEKQNWEKAAAHLAILSRDNNAPAGTVYELLGYAFIQLHDFTAAETALRNAIIHNRNSSPRLLLAQALAEQNKVQQAKIILKKLAEQTPEDNQIREQLITIALQQNNHREAMIQLELQQAYTGNTNLSLKADLYASEQDPDSAAQFYLEALKQNQLPLQKRLHAAQLFSSTGNKQSAEQLIRNLDKKSLSESQQISLHLIQSQLAEKTEIAEQHLQNLLKLDPLHTEALTRKSTLAAARNDHTEQIMLLRRLSTIPSHKLYALQQLTLAEASRQNWSDAADYCRKVIRITPSPTWSRYLTQLQNQINESL